MYAHWGRKHFSLPASLEPFQSIEGTTDLSVDRSFIAKDLVESLGVRDCRAINCYV
jgi:hypothetical protein